ncbi:hypothetical protein B4U80_06847 [Leptotrombidium deliense]|uniref:Uncharacterized protein n=1 Tax=Leptotrombidium deliense TaxID=299467 RepID=A0A443SK79_9ACAR|nr:hypothetical protein B4U80_06847 [Leptotrombidium deliense]
MSHEECRSDDCKKDTSDSGSSKCSPLSTNSPAKQQQQQSLTDYSIDQLLKGRNSSLQSKGNKSAFNIDSMVSMNRESVSSTSGLFRPFQDLPRYFGFPLCGLTPQSFPMIPHKSSPGMSVAENSALMSRLFGHSLGSESHPFLDVSHTHPFLRNPQSDSTEYFIRR